MEWVKENLKSNFKFVGVSFIIQETHNRNVYKEKMKIKFIENKNNNKFKYQRNDRIEQLHLIKLDTLHSI